MNQPKVLTCLWFDGEGEDAARLYTSLVPGSEITGTLGKTAAGGPLMVTFTLAGTPYQALNGGPQFKLDEAASIVVTTDDQGETDRLWDALTDGGREGRCGWLVDRFGVSWQIVPRALPALLGGPDPDGARRAMEAMLQMHKIDIAALEAAYGGGETSG